jgi:transposase-like protein
MKLTPRQWINIERAVLKDGQSVNAVAKKYKVNESTIRERLKSQREEQIKEVAEKIADAEISLKRLPVEKRFAAKSLAEHLVEISHTMAEVAALGVQNSLKLTQMKARAIDALSPGDSEGLKEVYMLAETANKSGKMAVDLMGVGKTLVMDKEKPAEVMTMAPINIPALKKP